MWEEVASHFCCPWAPCIKIAQPQFFFGRTVTYPEKTDKLSLCWKTLCSTRGPPRLIAKPGGTHHTSAAAHSFPLNLDITSEFFSTQWLRNTPIKNIWNLFTISSEPFYSPVYCRCKMLVSKFWSQLIWATPPKQTHTGKKAIYWVFWYFSIWNHLFVDNKWESATSCWQLILLSLPCQNPIKCRFLRPAPTPECKLLEIRLWKALVNSDVPSNLWTSILINSTLKSNEVTFSHGSATELGAECTCSAQGRVEHNNIC